jgi:hypothetical protein
MGYWKPLSNNVEPATRRLVVSLRVIKDQVGLSTTGLARKTPYSRSSWGRYLNGSTLPPRDAVSALAELAGANPTPVLAEWELAAAPTDPRPGAPSESPSPDAAPAAARPRRLGRLWRGRGRLAVLLLVVTAVAFSAGLWVGSLRRPGPPTPKPTAAELLGLRCAYTRQSGRLYAGHVTTSEELVLINQAGQKVIEVQCLLKRQGYDPGRIDGQFGEHTERAVKQLQRAGGEVIDGKVGARTWALLRR